MRPERLAAVADRKSILTDRDRATSNIIQSIWSDPSEEGAPQ